MREDAEAELADEDELVALEEALRDVRHALVARRVHLHCSLGFGVWCLVFGVWGVGFGV